jgi:hypothetical protein
VSQPRAIGAHGPTRTIDRQSSTLQKLVSPFREARMFPLTRPVRQALWTVAVLILVISPTAYVAATAWRIGQPGHLRELEVEIGRRLGLHVSLEGVCYPKPAEVVYRGVILRQEEPRRHGLTEIARATQVRLRRLDGELVLETEGLRLTGETPRTAMAQVGALLQRPVGGPITRISLSAPTCELDLGHDALRYELRDVAGTFQADAAAPAAQVSYRLKSPGGSTRCELALTRDRKADPIQTTLALKTMEGVPLPARVLDVFFDSADWLGASARVEGSLSLRQSGVRDWVAEFQGDLHDVDLRALVDRRFPKNHLAGLARVAIRSAHWGDRPGQGPGWLDANGELTTRHGKIGRGLFNALLTEMKFRPAKRGRLERVGPADGDVDFQALGLAFEIDRNGEIHLAGCLGREFDPATVLVQQSRALAFAPAGAANVRGLINTLFPTQDNEPGVLIPLTSESRVLLCLPAPPTVAGRTSAAKAN